jgi:recombination protein RecA
MNFAEIIRNEVESALASKMPSALSPTGRVIRPTQSTGIESLDLLLEGGLPIGTITELVGRECSGRTSVSHSLCAQITQSGRICAWVDVSDTFHPESATAVGIDLRRLLWVRCGRTRPPNTTPPSPLPKVARPSRYFSPSSAKRGLHGGSRGPHPRTEGKGMSDAICEFLNPSTIVSRREGPQRREQVEAYRFVPKPLPYTHSSKRIGNPDRPLTKIEQALRATDLILQGGGFSVIVLDMGGVAPEHSSRIPLATWFRYRAAAERTQTSFLLLSQYACAGSSAGVVLRLQDANPVREGGTVFAGLIHRVELTRERFMLSPSNVIPMRKPAQSEKTATWQSHVSWAGFYE